MQDRFTILLGGELTVTPRVKSQIAGSRIIAADGGIRHAEALQCEPELWVGDFDSADAALLQRYAHIPRDFHPADKDRTDGEIAVAAAISRGARALVLVGGLGGRVDHALAHLLLAVRLAGDGLTVMVTSGDEEAYPLLPGETVIALPAGTRVSVLALSPLSGLALAGVRWPLEGSDIPQGSGWTLSNVTAAPEVRIGLRAGQAVAIAYP